MSKIQDYWLDLIKEYREFQELAKTENPEISALLQGASNWLDDQFIQTATEKGIARREKLLKITPFADDDLESRRFRVQAKWNDKLPYTYRELVEKMNNLCGKDGYAMTLDSGDYLLSVKLELTKKRMFDEVARVVRQILPANILLVVELRFNQHSKLANYTHAQLAAYTHAQLREEAL